MTSSEIDNEIEKTIKIWESSFTVSPLDQLAKFQIKSDIIRMIMKVREES
jgi:hypothetical protein|tara:strand:+ start:859 stop:1008 length:150 start_codon:yes stop_codon:yes gene_type:complete